MHLPPFWEPYITADNHVEVIRTQTLPLVISLNGHSLKDHIHDRPQPPVVTAAPTKKRVHPQGVRASMSSWSIFARKRRKSMR